MARNIEIKARADDLEALERAVRALATGGPQVIRQDDTFFACANGRLKLREFDDGRGELIFYRRADQHEPGESCYEISPVAEPGSLRTALGLALGQRGRVRKHRTLYRIGRTRVHLDRVEGLGSFVELEVVLDKGEDATAGQREARHLLRRLAIDKAQLVDVAYIDLPGCVDAGS